MKISELDTPALLIEKQKLISNIKKMSKLAFKNNVDLRPHIKTHKMPEIAKIQTELGAIGITSAKVSEAMVFADHGFKNIRIANIVYGRQKFESLYKLQQKCDHLSICVDSIENVTELSEYFNSKQSVIEVLIEINVGMDRSGLKDDEEILKLAKLIKELKGIILIGILTHAGQSYNANSLDEIKDIGFWEGERMVQIADMLRSNSIPIKVVSVGSTPSVPYSAKVEGVTEIRPGNFVFFDIIQYALHSCSLEDCALSILSRVISKPSNDRYVVDAGKKALSADGSVFPGDAITTYGYILETGSRISKLSEEHGVVLDNCDVSIGDLVRIIPSHACTATNQFDKAYLFENDIVVDSFDIPARGKFY